MGIQRKVLWEGSQERKRIPLLSWDTVIKSKEDGRVGIKDLKAHNQALGAKLVWWMSKNPEALWSRILQAKYLDT